MHASTSRVLRITAVALLSIAGLGRLAADEPKGEAPADPVAQPIEAWHEVCQKCHAAPDTASETDRAFLRQITETT